MPLFLIDLAVEIIFLIARELSSKDIISLMQTNRCLCDLLPPALIDSVCRDRDSVRAKKALYSAAERRNSRVTKQLLDRGVFGSSHQRQMLLHGAVSEKDEEIGLTLLECGLDPEIRDKDGWTCLARAAAAGRKKITQALLGRDDVDVNARVGEGLTPFTVAIWKGEVSIVKMFLAHPRTDVHVRATRSRSPFHIAMENGRKTRKSILDHLLADGRLDPNLVDIDGNTALHLSFGRPPQLGRNLLLKNDRVHRSIPNAKGNTPLHDAVERRNRRAVNYMLRYCPGLRVNSGHLKHGTPLHVAASRGDRCIVRALLGKPSVNINSQDCLGETPLHRAAKLGRKAVVGLLLERRADYRLKNYDGNSVAMLVGTYDPAIRKIIEAYL